MDNQMYSYLLNHVLHPLWNLRNFSGNCFKITDRSWFWRNENYHHPQLNTYSIPRYSNCNEALWPFLISAGNYAIFVAMWTKIESFLNFLQAGEKLQKPDIQICGITCYSKHTQRIPVAPLFVHLWNSMADHPQKCVRSLSSTNCPVHKAQY